jgi:diguanylate cyclase (GGDEF)-like protein
MQTLRHTGHGVDVGIVTRWRLQHRRVLPLYALCAGLGLGALLSAGTPVGAALVENEGLWLSILFAGIVAFVLLESYLFGKLVRVLRRVRVAERRFNAVFERAIIGVARLTGTGDIAAANAELGHILNRNSADLAGKRFDRLFLDPFSISDFGRTREATLERQMLRGDGLHFWARLTAIDSPGETFVMLEDISGERMRRDSLERTSTHDGLTDLINRREIERRLEALIETVRTTDARHTCCYLDVDAFRLINESCGHAAGDKALRTIATALSNHTATTGWVGRLGGDEFVVLMEFAPLASGLDFAADLHRMLSGISLVWEDRRFQFTASIGVVEINRDTPSVEWLLRAADAACHLAKTDGRNRVRAYTASDKGIAQRRNELDWASQIHGALKHNRLLLYAQDIRTLGAARAGDGLQFEVLVRLQDEIGEIVLPGAFLSAAEHFSLATLVDRNVLTNTVAFLHRDAVQLQRVELCHVNISGQSATSTEFRQFAVDLFQAQPQIAAKICFEITETAAVDLTQANAFIAAMRKLGCRIALDDFGNGLASFAYLKRLPVDIVKIDGLFIREIGKSALDQEVVRSITQVCRAIGKQVVAEGVESPQAIERLRALGVDAVQGFAIHSPEPIDRFFAARAH